MGNALTALHGDRFDNGVSDLAGLDLEQRQRVSLFLAQSARYLGLIDSYAPRQPAASCCAAPTAIARGGIAIRP
jgi:hypothetical protein